MISAGSQTLLWAFIIAALVSSVKLVEVDHGDDVDSPNLQRDNAKPDNDERLYEDDEDRAVRGRAAADDDEDKDDADRLMERSEDEELKHEKKDENKEIKKVHFNRNNREENVKQVLQIKEKEDKKGKPPGVTATPVKGRLGVNPDTGLLDQAKNAVQWAKDSMNGDVIGGKNRAQIDNPQDVHNDIAAEAAGKNVNLQIPQRPEFLKVESIKKQIDRLQKMLQEVTFPRLRKQDLKPVDHLDAVRMEQDGHLNKDYLKEVFIGNHEEFDQDDKKKKTLKLKDIVFLIDVDHDGKLTMQELRAWIHEKVKEHLNEAAEESKKLFGFMDLDKDGYFSWQELLVHYLMSHGIDQDKAVQMVKEKGDEFDNLDDHDREEMLHHQYRWSAVDKNNDEKLTAEEFFNFRHPESSSDTLKDLAKEMVGDHDNNGDGKLSKQEFVEFVPIHSANVDPEMKNEMKRFADQRREEFNVIDSNKDGVATLDEVMKYLDPINEIHAQREAEYLLSMMDQNSDRMLSLEEILKKKEIFLDSKAMSVGKSFHDEF